MALPFNRKSLSMAQPQDQRFSKADPPPCCLYSESLEPGTTRPDAYRSGQLCVVASNPAKDRNGGGTHPSILAKLCVPVWNWATREKA